MITLSTKEDKWYEKLCWPTDVSVSGFIPSPAFKKIVRNFVDYNTLDLAKAVFDDEQMATSAYIGHSGQTMAVNRKDAEFILLQNVVARKLVLPDSIKLRTLNALIREGFKSYYLEVSADCILFSMKNGNIYNKKGTKLIYENTKEQPELAKCPVCGEEYLKQTFVTEGLRGRQISLRSAIELNLYECDFCGCYFPKDSLIFRGCYIVEHYSCEKCYKRYIGD